MNHLSELVLFALHTPLPRRISQMDRRHLDLIGNQSMICILCPGIHMRKVLNLGILCNFGMKGYEFHRMLSLQHQYYMLD